VFVNIGIDHKPKPNALKDLQWFTEKESSLSIVVEHERGNQARQREHMPQKKEC
jgi:hypothetical protein